MICAGIDAGSRAIKVAIYDAAARRLIATGAADQGIEQDALASGMLDGLLRDNGLAREDLARTVATGYARNIVSAADTTITEITCHACGVREVVPDAMTVIEIGGQDSKLLRLAANGSVRDFSMNDRCAAGTGRFLEMVATRLEVTLEQLGELAGRSTHPAAISSMCVVFAETEIIGLLAAGTPREDIIAGVQTAIASRISAMAGRNVVPPVVFTGGVALIPGMDRALQEVTGHPIVIAPDPQMTGALGAAVLAARQAGQ